MTHIRQSIYTKIGHINFLNMGWITAYNMSVVDSHIGLRAILITYVKWKTANIKDIPFASKFDFIN